MKMFSVMQEVVSGLRYAFQTQNEWTLPVKGTGVIGMNTVLINLLEPLDAILIGVNDYWGNVASIIATKIGSS